MVLINIFRNPRFVLSRVLACSLMVYALWACGKSANGVHAKNEEKAHNLGFSAEPVEVEVVEVEIRPFALELLANGRVYAARKARLVFETDGKIQPFALYEGQSVQEGQVLATLDPGLYLSQRERALLDLSLARLDFEDHLLRLGYHLADSASMDLEMKHNLYLRTGMYSAELAYKNALLNLENIALRAPFSGTIANLMASAHNSAFSYEFFCELVDLTSLEVAFKVLGHELSYLRDSDLITISAFGEESPEFEGRIIAINPVVDAHGLVAVTAKVLEQTTESPMLMNGSAVQVRVKKMTEPLLQVPKEAVLERQGRRVVFTVDNEHSQWNYVDILHENQSHYALKSGLKEGDRVIVRGHFNLSHEHPVRVK